MLIDFSLQVMCPLLKMGLDIPTLLNYSLFISSDLLMFTLCVCACALTFCCWIHKYFQLLYPLEKLNPFQYTMLFFSLSFSLPHYFIWVKYNCFISLLACFTQINSIWQDWGWKSTLTYSHIAVSFGKR